MLSAMSLTASRTDLVPTARMPRRDFFLRSYAATSSAGPLAMVTAMARALARPHDGVLAGINCAEPNVCRRSPLRGLLDSILVGPPFAARKHPTSAIAEHNQPVRVLGYQGFVQSASDVEPLMVGVDIRGMTAHFYRSPG
jgi:hypothetical protein